MHESGSRSPYSDKDAENPRGSERGSGVRSTSGGALAAAGSLLTTATVSPDGLVGPKEIAGENAPFSPSSSSSGGRASEGPGSESMRQMEVSGAGTGGNGECVQGGCMPAGFLGVQILWEVRSDAWICIHFCFFSSHPRSSAVLGRHSSSDN